MGVTVQDLATLDPALVAQYDTELTTLLNELNPTLDLSAGVLHDLLLHLKAILDAATEQNITLVREANSLAAIAVDPTLADSTVVDNCLSNFNVVRNPGTTAGGPIAIVLSSLTAVVIPNGALFTIGGLEFITTTAYAARTSSDSVTTSNDVLISAVGNGTYVFTVPVEAVAIGSLGNVTRGTEVTPDQPPPDFSSAYVKADFVGGTDPDTNTTLMTKLAQGLAIKSWSNRPSDMSLITKQPDFENILNSSIIGFGDSEMLRDQHSIWPGSTGGRNDVYLRSQEMYQNQVITKTATLVSKLGQVGTWQFGVALNDAPGFYVVDRILLTTQSQTATGFQPSSDVRGLDLSTDPLPPPDIVETIEGVYSRYQTAVIQFNDTITDVTSTVLGTTQDYNVVLRVMPLVAEVQDFINVRENRPPTSDVLIKAPMPCFTAVTLTVNYKNGTTAPTIAAVQNSVADAVNAMSFSGTLATSYIAQALQTTVPNLVSLTDVSLDGDIRAPDGTTASITGTESIEIPDDFPNMVSGRTTAFFLDPADVDVTLVAVDTPNV